LSGTSQVRQLLAGPEKKGAPAAKAGVRHETSTWGGSHASMLDTIALFEEEGPEGRGAAPAKWTFRWHDPQELGGKPRTVTMPAPKGLTMGASLRSAAASGGRALFTVRTSSKTMLVRVRATGAPEVAEVPFDLSPSTDVVFGSERGEAIAWTRDTAVVVWLSGERPRAIAKLATHVTRVLGTPTAAGVPVLLSATDWALARVLPIPPLDKGATTPPPPEPPSFDGWTRVTPVAPRLASLPACANKPAGMRFSLSRISLRAEIDGIPEHATETIYDLRIAGGEACIAGLSAALTPDRRSPPPPPPGQKPAKAPPKSGPASFVRADFSGKRAEGGDRGVAPAAAVRGMKCALGGKP
jgi:hypothetical protein